MSYGHADKIARIAAAAPAAGSEKPAPVIDPALYHRDDVRPVLAERDIAGLFRVLKDDTGLTQRTIAELVGMSQSEVSEILDGRRVIAYDVLVRIAEGLRIPRERMGISYGETGAYPGQSAVTSPPEEVIAEMLRRHVLALSTIAAFGGVTVGELLAELSSPSPVPLPSVLSGVHVVKVQDLTRTLAEAGMTFGSNPEVSSSSAAWATQLLDVPGAEPVKRAMITAVAELHIHAGRAAFDANLYNRTMYHCAQGLGLATQAKDVYLQVLALNWAGLATMENGDPDEGLKLLQVAQFRSEDIPSDDNRRNVVEACGCADSATAYARLGYQESADAHLGKARELWTPTRNDHHGDLDQVAASLKIERGHLDAAESFAQASILRWEGISKRARTYSGIVLSTIYVKAGEPRGLQLAHSAIDAADKLSSMRARLRLVPLADALAARRNSDAQQLARMARQVASTRA